MPTFRVNTLPKIIRSVHDSQNKWRDKNWKQTLAAHANELEGLLKKIDLLDKWQNKLMTEEPAKLLMPEIFSDPWISTHLAGFGLYRYANMCLRSELENTLRLIYFVDHPVEFLWWKNDNNWQRESTRAIDVWGQTYEYFAQLDCFKNFDKECAEGKQLFNGKKKISKIHQELSKFIHSSAGYLQTRHTFKPKYNLGEFKKWKAKCEEVQSSVHILLALNFSEEFKTMTQGDRAALLDIGIGDLYKEEIKKALGF